MFGRERIIPPASSGPQGAQGAQGASGANGMWTLIGSQTLGGNAATMTISGISSGNNFLKLTGYIKGSLSTNILYIRFNNDSGGNYYTQRLSAATSTVTAAQLTGQAQIAVYTGVSGSIFAPIEIFIQNDSSGQQKTGWVRFSDNENDIRMFSFRWTDTSAEISSIQLLWSAAENFVTGSKIVVEGSTQ